MPAHAGGNGEKTKGWIWEGGGMVRTPQGHHSEGAGEPSTDTGRWERRLEAACPWIEMKCIVENKRYGKNSVKPSIAPDTGVLGWPGTCCRCMQLRVQPCLPSEAGNSISPPLLLGTRLLQGWGEASPFPPMLCHLRISPRSAASSVGPHWRTRPVSVGTLLRAGWK